MSLFNSRSGASDTTDESNMIDEVGLCSVSGGAVERSTDLVVAGNLRQVATALRQKDPEASSH
jgi:hypothetical protein